MVWMHTMNYYNSTKLLNEIVRPQGAPPSEAGGLVFDRGGNRR